MNFEWEGKKIVTLGDIGDACVAIAKEGDTEKAAEFMRLYVEDIREAAKGDDPMDMVRSNIGYLSGYYDVDTGAEIRRVFAVSHPVFGSMTSPDPDALFQAGKDHASGRVAPHTQVMVAHLPKCDFRWCDVDPHDGLYDGKTRNGPWANMCQAAFDQEGIGLGLGKGQKLIVTESVGG